MLTDMLYPDRVAVAKIEPWMNGTTVTINNQMEIDAFHCGAQATDGQLYKTVNIYSLTDLRAAELVCNSHEQLSSFTMSPFLNSSKAVNYSPDIKVSMAMEPAWKLLQ
jgi:hypothetical protein